MAALKTCVLFVNCSRKPIWPLGDAMTTLSRELISVDKKWRNMSRVRCKLSGDMCMSSMKKSMERPRVVEAAEVLEVVGLGSGGAVDCSSIGVCGLWHRQRHRVYDAGNTSQKRESRPQ